jgi:hypothetical protein
MSSGWDVLGSVANTITAIAAAAAAWQAWKSLSSWRAETIGRRRLALAEEVLADFYEARDVFRWVRSPMGFAADYEQRPGRDEEPEDVRGHRDTYYAPIKRLSDHSEFFSKLQARKYRVIATFGKAAAKPYDDLQKIHSKIVVAARMLMNTRPDVSRNERDAEREERQLKIIWEGYSDPDEGDSDEIAEAIDQMVTDVERVFRAEITKNIT